MLPEVTAAYRVAVIGAGVAGSVCATRLAQLPYVATTVYDMGSRGPGGRACDLASIASHRILKRDPSRSQSSSVRAGKFRAVIDAIQLRPRAWPPGPRGALRLCNK